MAAPEWIAVGTPVVTYNDHPHYTRKTRIEKVNTKTFRVEGEALLYRIDDQQTPPPHSWAAPRRAVPAGSEEAYRRLALHAAHARRLEANHAVRRYLEAPSHDTIQAAITALTNHLVDHPKEN